MNFDDYSRVLHFYGSLRVLEERVQSDTEIRKFMSNTTFSENMRLHSNSNQVSAFHCAVKQLCHLKEFDNTEM